MSCWLLSLVFEGVFEGGSRMAHCSSFFSGKVELCWHRTGVFWPSLSSPGSAWGTLFALKVAGMCMGLAWRAELPVALFHLRPELPPLLTPSFCAHVD